MLQNDTVDGEPATLQNVCLTQVSSTCKGVVLGASRNLNSTQVVVLPGTPPGTYVLRYQICDQLFNCEDNCAQGNVFVTVGKAKIEAAPYNVKVPFSDTPVVAVPSVLADSTLGGKPIRPKKVTLSLVSGDPQLKLNTSTGTVTVAKGTPLGTYRLRYQICENFAFQSCNPDASNCDIATVTVHVINGVIIQANPDSATVASSPKPVVAIPNVLANDTLNGAPATTKNVTISLIKSDPHLRLKKSTGEVIVKAGTPAGVYKLKYKICQKTVPANCSSTTVTVTVEESPLPPPRPNCIPTLCKKK